MKTSVEQALNVSAGSQRLVYKGKTLSGEFWGLVSLTLHNGSVVLFTQPSLLSYLIIAGHDDEIYCNN